MENIEKLSTQITNLNNVLTKSQKSVEDVHSRFGKLEKGFVGLQSGVSKLATSFTNLGPAIAGVFGGASIINTVEKYNRTLFEVNKTVNLTGQSMDNFLRVQDRLGKSTTLSQANIASLYDTMSKSSGIRITIEQFEKLTNILNKVYGPAQEQILAGFNKLESVAAKSPMFLQNMTKGMNAAELNSYIASLMEIGALREDQVDEIYKLNDAATGEGKIVDKKAERYRKLSDTIQKLQQIGENFIIRFGEPLTELFTIVAEKVGHLAEKMLELTKSEYFGDIVKLGGIAAAGFGAAKVVGGVGGAVGSLFGSGRDGKTKSSALYVQEVSGSGSLIDKAGELLDGDGKKSGKGGGKGSVLFETFNWELIKKVFSTTTSGLTTMAKAAWAAKAAIGAVAVGVGVAAAAFGLGIHAYKSLKSEEAAFQSMNDTNSNLIRVKSGLGSQGKEIDAAEKKLQIAMMRKQSFLDMNKGEARKTEHFREQLALLDKQVESAIEFKNEMQNQFSSQSGESQAGKARALAMEQENMRKIYAAVIPALEEEQSLLKSKIELNNKYEVSLEKGLKFNKDMIVSLKTQEDYLKRNIDLQEARVAAAKREFLSGTSIKDTKRDLNVLIQEALLLGGEDAKLAGDLEQAMQGQNKNQKQLLDVRSQLRDSWKQPIRDIEAQKDSIEKSLTLDEARLSLNEKMLGPIGQNFELRSKIYDSLNNSISKIDTQLMRAREALALDKDNKEIKDEINKLETERLSKVAKQVDLTKSLRDGYLSALTSFSNVEGTFSKYVITRESGLATAMKDFGAAQGFGSGAIGAGGDTPFMQWAPDGSLKMDNAAAATKRAQGYQKHYDTDIPQIHKDFGASPINAMQKNALIGGPNVSPMTGSTGQGSIKVNEMFKDLINPVAPTGPAPSIEKGRQKGGGVSLQFYINGESSAQILSAVNSKLGKVLSDMMGPGGSTGRNYELQVT